MDDSFPLDRRLRLEILQARERVYRFGQATPLERLMWGEGGPEVWVKREDLSPVKSYKWRGACNRMALLGGKERERGVVTASAGNHAQGVALAAKALGVRARIYMPRSTPQVKQAAVGQHGGEWVTVRLCGDSYDEAVTAAREDASRTGGVYVHAYDDLQVMAGQGTLADEVVLSGKGPFDVAFLQIGGGGLAAASSLWLKTFWPDMEVVGVEGCDQASMKAALCHGEPVSLEELDIFCDGTAVRKAGEYPFAVCRGTLDRLVTVNNEEVSRGIRCLWDGLRCVSEPSGAMGVAALLREAAGLSGKRVLVVVTGANIDFLNLGLIAQSVGVGSLASMTIRVKISERAGSMLDLLDRCFGGLNVVDFQYGKVDGESAWPVITVSSDQADGLAGLAGLLDVYTAGWEEVTGATDVQFRVIPLRGDLLRWPMFLRLDFYEREGALHDFLDKRVRGRASLCYFNYRQSGERIGRALLGLEFDGMVPRDDFVRTLPKHGDGYRACEVVEEQVWKRMTGVL